MFLTLFLLCNSAKVVGFRMVFSSSEPTPFCVLVLAAETVAVLLVIHVSLWSGRHRLSFTLFYLVQAVYLVVNMLYFLSLKDYLRLDELLVLAEQAMFVVPYCYGDINPMYLLMFVDLPLFLAVLFLPMPAVHLDPRRLRRLEWLFLAAYLVGLPVAYQTFQQRDRLTPWDLDPDPKTAEELYVQKHGLLLFTVFDSLFTRRNYRAMELRVSKNTTLFPQRKPPRNIVMIQIEAMGASVLQARHGGKYVMPYLHRLSTQVMYYPFMMSYHKGGGTSDCDFTVLNSIEPLNSSSVLFKEDYGYPNSVVKVLRAAGYSAYTFHGNTGQCWNRKVAFPKMGYEILYDQETMGLPSAGWGAPDKDVFDYTWRALAGKRQPFFVHVITMSSHFPYNSVPIYYENTRFDDIPSKEVREYFVSMAYVDQALEEFVEKLRQIKNTTIIIYGDHAPSRQVCQYFTMAKFSIRTNVLEFVPFLMVTPEGTQFRERNCVATFLDVAPTILDVAGIGCTYATSGQSLLTPPVGDSEIPLRGSLYLRSYLMKKCRSMAGGSVWKIQSPESDSRSSSSPSSSSGAGTSALRSTAGRPADDSGAGGGR